MIGSILLISVKDFSKKKKCSLLILLVFGKKCMAPKREELVSGWKINFVSVVFKQQIENPPR